MSADILHAILESDSNDDAPKTTKKPAALRPLPDDATRITLNVLRDYDTKGALSALSQHHHVSAMKIVRGLADMLMESMRDGARRTELDGALDACLEWVERAREQRKQSKRFEAASLVVGDAHPFSQVVAEIEDAARKNQTEGLESAI